MGNESAAPFPHEATLYAEYGSSYDSEGYIQVRSGTEWVRVEEFAARYWERQGYTVFRHDATRNRYFVWPYHDMANHLSEFLRELIDQGVLPPTRDSHGSLEMPVPHPNTWEAVRNSSRLLFDEIRKRYEEMLQPGFSVPGCGTRFRLRGCTVDSSRLKPWLDPGSFSVEERGIGCVRCEERQRLFLMREFRSAVPYLNALGSFALGALWLARTGKPGWPDLLVSGKGQRAWCEVKSEHDKASKFQREWASLNAAVVGLPILVLHVRAQGTAPKRRSPVEEYIAKLAVPKDHEEEWKTIVEQLFELLKDGDSLFHLVKGRRALEPFALWSHDDRVLRKSLGATGFNSLKAVLEFNGSSLVEERRKNPVPDVYRFLDPSQPRRLSKEERIAQAQDKSASTLKDVLEVLRLARETGSDSDAKVFSWIQRDPCRVCSKRARKSPWSEDDLKKSLSSEGLCRFREGCQCIVHTIR